MDKHVRELISRFDYYAEAFDSKPRFTGPTVYFHRRTIERLRKYGSPSVALHDDAFIESLYATLASWGMHRMGRSGAKMADLDVFASSLRSHAERIATLLDFLRSCVPGLDPVKLSQVPTNDVGRLSDDLWAIIDGLQIGTGETKIVIGSKALHHLIPEVVPPIDRRYTVRFFFHHEPPLSGERGGVAFSEMFPQLHRIAVACESKIDSLIGKGSMGTSFTKIIDNAIVGFGLKEQGIEPNED